MLRAAQAKWISRLVTRTSIQDALMQYDQQLRDAATSFQVRCLPTFMLLFFFKLGTEIEVRFAP